MRKRQWEKYMKKLFNGLFRLLCFVFFPKNIPNAYYSTWHKIDAQKYSLKEWVTWANLQARM